MPLGSSSAAPVIRPGPSLASHDTLAGGGAATSGGPAGLGWVLFMVRTPMVVRCGARLNGNRRRFCTQAYMASVQELQLHWSQSCHFTVTTMSHDLSKISQLKKSYAGQAGRSPA